MFLRELKYAHHLRRIPFEKIALLGMPLSVAHKERLKLLFVRADKRQKTEERARAIGGAAGHELLGDAFRDAKNISRVLVIIAHQLFAAQLAALLPVMQSLRDLFLHVEMQDVGRAAGHVVALGGQEEQ